MSRGTLAALGEIQIPLKKYTAPDKLQLEISLVGTNIRNTYNFWLYPDAADTAAGKVLVGRALDDAARAALAGGGSVLLIPAPASLTQSIEGSFAPDFWNYGMFRKMAEERHAPIAPGTLGMLCDPKHPAFAHLASFIGHAIRSKTLGASQIAPVCSRRSVGSPLHPCS